MALVCAKCHKPLVVEVELGDDEEEHAENIGMESAEVDEDAMQTVPDDVSLPCGCHFHWECLLDSYELSKCPNCTRGILTSEDSSSSSSEPTQRLLVDLNNEGGLQEEIDILPIIREESYLRAYPEERKCRAFLEFCGEGDYHAMVDLLKSCSERTYDDEMETEETGAEKTADEILRYQDPIGEMASGLHAAVANGHREAVWLLLLLASELPEIEFPALVFQEAATLGIMRNEDLASQVDIRSLKDARGRTAEDIAREAGVIWTGWIGNGRLAMP